MNLPTLSIVLPTKENDVSLIIDSKIKIKPYFSRIQSLYFRLSEIMQHLEYGGYWKKEKFMAIKQEVFELFDDYEKQRSSFLPVHYTIHIIQCCEYLYEKLITDFRFCLDYEICENDIEMIESEVIESIRTNENIFLGVNMG